MLTVHNVEWKNAPTYPKVGGHVMLAIRVSDSHLNNEGMGRIELPQNNNQFLYTIFVGGKMNV